MTPERLRELIDTWNARAKAHSQKETDGDDEAACAIEQCADDLYTLIDEAEWQATLFPPNAVMR